MHRIEDPNRGIDRRNAVTKAKLVDISVLPILLIDVPSGHPGDRPIPYPPKKTETQRTNPNPKKTPEKKGTEDHETHQKEQRKPNEEIHKKNDCQEKRHQ
ncbi:hypothetical protein Q9L58_002255, partial [Maublancomyces gigas]